jgi:co-chaperonin GroES (HSP10)
MEAVKDIDEMEPEKAHQLPKPQGYADKKRFPSGAYCKEGDFIIMRSYSGTRIKIHGKEFRLINDDSVEAVVDDPRGVYKA